MFEMKLHSSRNLYFKKKRNRNMFWTFLMQFSRGSIHSVQMYVS